MYRRFCRLSTLHAAWSRVEESDGCAGVDAVTIARFARNLESELAQLSSELTKETYKPLPLVRFFVTKSNGGQRPLSVPAVRDRIVQHGVISVVGPIFEKEFDNCSFAYRKGKSVKQALQQVEYLRESGYHWVLDADITSYFDNVDHGLLFARVGELVPDKRVLSLMREWVAARIYDGHQISQLQKGLPQGAPISPMLANLYLDTFDDQMLSSGQKLVRFADDFVVLCKSKPQAERALKLTRRILANLRLTLSDEKTRVTNFTDGFKYLGATFTGSLALVHPPSAEPLDAEVFLPPPLPVLRAAPVKAKPFNSAIKDALLQSLEDVSAEEIPSFFKLSRADGEASDEAGGAEEGQSQSPQPSSSVCGGRSERVKDDKTNATLNDKIAEGLLSGMPPGAYEGESSPPPPDQPERPPLPPPTLLTLRTLYIHEHGATIRCEDEHLRILNKDEVEILSLPAFKIDQIVLFGNSQVTTSAMKFCLRNKIPI
ncbi:MAG: reverse transcriptase domain-containing protein, partial [Pyrinomonadaceae bacterium]